VKFETTSAFKRDFNKLPEHHKDKFRQLVLRFNDAAEKAARGENNPWPKGMRVKPIKSAEQIWELTWSMNDPDGRATWEWIKIDGEAAIRWRRVGDHDVLDNA
jgi:hypothetical protein